VIRRPFWLATGMAIGVGGTLWAEHRVRRLVEETQTRLSPDHVVRTAARSAQGLPARVRAANAAATEARRRRERELRQRMAPGPDRPALTRVR
jgi:hypothetical protein